MNFREAEFMTRRLPTAKTIAGSMFQRNSGAGVT